MAKACWNRAVHGDSAIEVLADGKLMRQFPLSSIVAVGVVLFVGIHRWDAIVDPLAASTARVEKTYFNTGEIASETTFNRRGEKHGLQVIYDLDGSIREEYVYRHDEWQVHRLFHYDEGLVYVTIATWTAPYTASSTEPMPDWYRDYRNEERQDPPRRARLDAAR